MRSIAIMLWKQAEPKYII